MTPYDFEDDIDRARDSLFSQGHLLVAVWADPADFPDCHGDPTWTQCVMVAGVHWKWAFDLGTSPVFEASWDMSRSDRLRLSMAVDTAQLHRIIRGPKR